MSVPAAGTRRALPAPAAIAAPSDRHFRRSEQRPARRRRLSQLALRLAAGAAVTGAVLIAALWTGSWLAGSSMLQIDRLRVRGTARLSAAEVETLLAGLRGQNILAVDLESFRRQALDSPWVAGVTLSRVLPSTIDVQIAERVPMAIARYARQLYLIDGAGVIIDEYGPQYRDVDLPIVDGLIASPPAGAPAIDAARLQVTAELLAALAASPDVGARVSQVDVSSAYDVVVLLGDDPARLHVGNEAFVERLRQYLELLPSLRDQLTAIDYVDLRFGDRVFARAQGRSATVQRTAAR